MHVSLNIRNQVDADREGHGWAPFAGGPPGAVILKCFVECWWANAGFAEVASAVQVRCRSRRRIKFRGAGCCCNQIEH